MIIYLTGLGATSPAVDDGMPAPASPLASAMSTPDVTLGGVPLGVQYAGLVPGYVGSIRSTPRFRSASRKGCRFRW